VTWVRGRGNLLSRPADVGREAQWVLAGELIRDGYVLDRRGPALLYSPMINEALRHGADARYELLGRRRPPAPMRPCRRSPHLRGMPNVAALLR
jgi:hypothetical protein